MPRNDDFLSLETTSAWLSQFDPGEQALLIRMLRAMRLVSADEFINEMRALILSRISAEQQLNPVGLYAEREVLHRNGIPVSHFKQPDRPVRRAFGAGPKAVDPKLPWNQDIGSEGIVAQLISELCRERPSELFSHPGPNAIRRHRIRRFIVVSDFIGSGQRAKEYLAAAWRAWSVRSWWAARAVKGLHFEVVAYSSTEKGKRVVEAHACTPTVHVVAPSPTIDSDFDEPTAEAIKAVCVFRDPVKPESDASLGYRGTGALIAFSHGAPNNVPRLLTERRASGRFPGYAPLFPKRVTAGSREAFASGHDSVAEIRAALEELGQRRLAVAQLPDELDPQQGKALLLLAALTKPPRSTEALAGRTGLTILEVESAFGRISSLGWIDGNGRLTDRGQAQLRQARRRTRTKPSVPDLPSVYYYPRLLRAPVGPFSDAG